MPFSKRILWEFYNNRPHWSAHKGEGVGLVASVLFTLPFYALTLPYIPYPSLVSIVLSNV